jgi:hypothetical protein
MNNFKSENNINSIIDGWSSFGEEQLPCQILIFIRKFLKRKSLVLRNGNFLIPPLYSKIIYVVSCTTQDKTVDVWISLREYRLGKKIVKINIKSSKKIIVSKPISLKLIWNSQNIFFLFRDWILISSRLTLWHSTKLIFCWYWNMLCK